MENLLTPRRHDWDRMTFDEKLDYCERLLAFYPEQCVTSEKIKEFMDYLRADKKLKQKSQEART